MTWPYNANELSLDVWTWSQYEYIITGLIDAIIIMSERDMHENRTINKMFTRYNVQNTI